MKTDEGWWAAHRARRMVSDHTAHPHMCYVHNACDMRAEPIPTYTARAIACTLGPLHPSLSLTTRQLTGKLPPLPLDGE